MLFREEDQYKHTQGMVPLGSLSLISEYKVIREVLWILQVPSNTFLFNLTNDGRILTNEGIAIPSLTSVSMKLFFC